MKHLIFVFFILLGLLSCRQSSVHQVLSGIDSILLDDPQIAMDSLDSLDKRGEKKSEADAMFAKLLRFSASNQLYLPLEHIEG